MTNNLIDCFMIIYKEPSWKIDRCLSSLEGQSVNLHIIQGEEEYPPFKGRAKGFNTGTAPYVTYVDPDDWVEPNAIEILLNNLGNYDVVYGSENVVRDGKIITKDNSIHHLYVTKRNLPIDYSREGIGVQLQDRYLSILKLKDTLYNWDITGKQHGRVG